MLITESYSPDTDEWTEMPSMTTKRSAMGCVAHDGSIYVCGGYDGALSINTCEMYNNEVGEWKRISNMNKARSALAVTSFQGSVHVLGGHDGLSIFNSVECYDQVCFHL